MKKYSRNKIALIVGIVAIGLSLLTAWVFAIIYMAREAGERDKKEALEFYGNVGNYITVTASIESVKPVNDLYGVVLTLHGDYPQLKNFDSCELLNINSDEAVAHGFALTAGDKEYMFTVTRAKADLGPSGLSFYPIVAISEVDGSKEYLSFKAGLSNVLDHIKKL